MFFILKERLIIWQMTLVDNGKIRKEANVAYYTLASFLYVGEMSRSIFALYFV